MIAVVTTKRPDEAMIKAMFDANDAGAGIAWRENGMVKWEKGLNLNDITDMCLGVPVPYVAHFRIPTEGGRLAELCHPFPIEKGVPLDTSGQTSGQVLFHNGHWGAWKAYVMETLVKIPHVNIKMPGGAWSDTRAMAWVASIYGPAILNFINEKAVVFGPEVGDLEVFHSSSGAKWDKVNDIYVSNRGWESRWRGTTHGYMGGHEYATRMCKHQQCSREENLDSEGFCPRHGKKPVAALPGEVSMECKNGNCRRWDNINEQGYCPAHAAEGRIITAAVEGAKKRDEKAGGTSDNVIPFVGPMAKSSVMADADETFQIAFLLWKDGQLSNKKFKAARKTWDEALRQERARTGRKAMSQDVTPPVTVIH